MCECVGLYLTALHSLHFLLNASTFGDFRLQENTRQSLHMMRTFRAPFISDRMREHGSHGPLPNVIFFMWLVAHNRCWTADKHARRGLPTRPNVCCVNRNRKASSISWLDAFLLGTPGFLSCSALGSLHSRLSPLIQLERTGGKKRKQLPLGMQEKA
jgi:hypothetical protein